MFGHRPDIYPDGQEICSDQDRPNRKYGAKFVRTAGEPPPLFSGVLLSLPQLLDAVERKLATIAGTIK